MSELINHANRELVGYDGSFYGDLIPKAVLELLEVFSSQGHSGMSAPLVIQLFTKLAAFQPLGPLTGDDSEWNEVSGGTFQNIRCSTVFKQADRFDGQAYDIEGRIFRSPSGCCFTNADSRVPVVFPYTPTREYVDVPE